MTEFQENYIYGHSKKYEIHESISGSFDLLLISCGWESRCVDFIKRVDHEFRYEYASVISFRLGEEPGYDREYMEDITELIERSVNKENASFIENEVTNLTKIVYEIKKLILDLIKKLNRPLNLAFDITCCPRYVFLFLVAFCLRNNLTKELTIFYSEPNYQTKPNNYVHTKGKWRLIEIPGLEPRNIILNRSLIVVSAGWEGKYYRRMVANSEPDYLGILLPNPGFSDQYTEKTWSECKPLAEEYNLTSDAIIKVHAGDAIAAWKSLEAPLLNRPDCQIYYLTFGTKPHALAMGIRGILHDEISVLNRIPNGYYKINALGNGNIWRYDLVNLIYL
jgi:hypothetical protein